MALPGEVSLGLPGDALAIDGGGCPQASWLEGEAGFLQEVQAGASAWTLSLGSLPWAGVRCPPPPPTVASSCPSLSLRSVPCGQQAPLSSTSHMTYFYWEWESQRKDNTRKQGWISVLKSPGPFLEVSHAICLSLAPSLPLPPPSVPAPPAAFSLQDSPKSFPSCNSWGLHFHNQNDPRDSSFNKRPILSLLGNQLRPSLGLKTHGLPCKPTCLSFLLSPLSPSLTEHCAGEGAQRSFQKNSSKLEFISGLIKRKKKKPSHKEGVISDVLAKLCCFVNIHVCSKRQSCFDYCGWYQSVSLKECQWFTGVDKCHLPELPNEQSRILATCHFSCVMRDPDATDLVF